MQLQLYGNKIWVYNQAVDFRASIDGLTALIVNKLKQNPQFPEVEFNEAKK